MATIASSNPNGASVAYSYDDLNRLNATATYTYDAASNLATATYSNGVQSTFSYDSLNRVSSLTSQVAGYTYQRGPIGNLASVAEQSGRAVQWNYDGINRLTRETINSDPAKKNGSVSYSLDPVGNRLSDISSLSGVNSGSGNFNADDELTSETHDLNGNTTNSNGKSYTYDAENHLRSMTASGTTVQLAYDAFGNRVAKSVNGVVTQYLVEDDVNPTGYPQVFDELTGGAVTRTYAYGLQRISQDQIVNNQWTASFYGYDGGGSVRQLTNANGIVTDTYDYDAFGNKLNVTGSTPNNYLYRGEQFDQDLALYYLCARYYNPNTGRFMSRDPQEYTPLKWTGPLGLTGNPPIDPKKLHKYLYAGGDPVNMIDPRGREELGDEAGAIEKSVDETEQAAYELKTLMRYEIQQAEGVEGGAGAEDAVPGGNIDTTGSQQFVKQLLRDLMNEWNSK